MTAFCSFGLKMTRKIGKEAAFLLIFLSVNEGIVSALTNLPQIVSVKVNAAYGYSFLLRKWDISRVGLTLQCLANSSGETSIQWREVNSRTLPTGWTYTKTNGAEASVNLDAALIRQPQSDKYEGSYECVVNSSAGVVVSSPVKLSFADVFVTPVEAQRQSQWVVASIGSTLILPCNATGPLSFRPPELRTKLRFPWRYRDKVNAEYASVWANPSFVERFAINDAGTLYIRSLQESDTLVESFTCTIDGSWVLTQTIGNYSIIKNQTPTNLPTGPKLIYKSQDTTVTAASSVVLHCVFEDIGLPTEDVVWNRCVSTQISKGASIALVKVDSSYNGNWTCAYKTLSGSISLTVLYNPQLLSSGDNYALSQQSAEFSCWVASNEATHFDWYYNDYDVRTSSRFTVFTNGSFSSLVIKIISSFETGVIRCSATNQLSTVSQNMRLIALDLPVVKLSAMDTSDVDNENLAIYELKSNTTNVLFRCNYLINAAVESARVVWQLEYYGGNITSQTVEPAFGLNNAVYDSSDNTYSVLTIIVTNASRPNIVGKVHCSLVFWIGGREFLQFSENTGQILRTSRAFALSDFPRITSVTVNAANKSWFLFPKWQLSTVGLKLRCLATASGDTDIQWRQAGSRTLPAGWSYSTKNGGEATVFLAGELIRQQSEKYEGSYECVVNDVAGIVASSPVKISIADIYAASIEAWRPSRRIYASLGSTVIMPCNSTAPVTLSHPTLKTRLRFSWSYRNQITMEYANIWSNPAISERFVVNDAGTLYIRGLKESDLSVESFVCNIEWNYQALPTLGNYSIFKNQALTNLPVGPKLIYKTPDTSIAAGSTLVLHCVFEDTDSPTENVIWNRPVSSTRSKGSSAALASVDYRHNGVWVCTYKNVSGTIELTVLYDPQLESSGDNYAFLKDSVTYSCWAASTDGVQFDWYYNDYDVRMSNRFTVFTNGSLSRLILQSADNVEVSVVRCSATNQLSTVSHNMRLIVLERPVVRVYAISDNNHAIDGHPAIYQLTDSTAYVQFQCKHTVSALAESVRVVWQLEHYGSNVTAETVEPTMGINNAVNDSSSGDYSLLKIVVTDLSRANIIGRVRCLLIFGIEGKEFMRSSEDIGRILGTESASSSESAPNFWGLDSPMTYEKSTLRHEMAAIEQPQVELIRWKTGGAIIGAMAFVGLTVAAVIYLRNRRKLAQNAEQSKTDEVENAK